MNEATSVVAADPISWLSIQSFTVSAVTATDGKTFLRTAQLGLPALPAAKVSFPFSPQSVGVYCE